MENNSAELATIKEDVVDIAAEELSNINEDSIDDNEFPVVEEIIFNKEELDFLPKVIETFSLYENYIYTGLISLKLLIESDNYQKFKKYENSIKDEDLYEKVLVLPNTLQEFIDFLINDFDKSADKHIATLNQNAIQAETADSLPNIIPPQIAQDNDAVKQEEIQNSDIPLSMRPMPD
jgi:hypothetical protein